MANLIIKNIKKTFDEKLILNNFNLEIKDKEFTVLLGPSGCGKSTILKIISGIIPQDTGSIIIDDTDISNLPINKRNTVMIFQEHLLFPHMTVFDNIAFGLKMRKQSKFTIKKRVDHLLNLVKLPEHKNHYPFELSGGQKQRVVLARALAVIPKLLLLDEPFSSLDPELRVEMRRLLKKIQEETKITMLMVTHDKDEAFSLGHKVAIMLKHKIEQIETPQNIYLKPSSPNIANFFGKTCYISGIINENVFTGCEFSLILNNTYKYKNKTSVSLLLRPENIEPSNKGNKCRIINKEFYGDSILYSLQNINIISNTLYMLTEPKYDFYINEIIFINIKPHEYIFFNNN